MDVSTDAAAVLTASSGEMYGPMRRVLRAPNLSSDRDRLGQLFDRRTDRQIQSGQPQSDALSRLAAISRPMMESIPTSCSGCDKAKLGSSICMTLVTILTRSA